MNKNGVSKRYAFFVSMYYASRVLDIHQEVCSPGATWNKWIVDKKAYDEQVIVGYKCSCGEWKLVTN